MDCTDAQIAEVMRRLGILQSDILRARTSQRALDALKSRVRKSYKKLALETHPDHAGGDPAKVELFKLATEVVEEIGAMEPEANPRRTKWAVRLKARAVVT